MIFSHTCLRRIYKADKQLIIDAAMRRKLESRNFASSLK